MNYKKIHHSIITIAGSLVLGIWQVSFIQTLPQPVNLINLPLAVIVLLSIQLKLRKALQVAFVSGYLSGIVSYHTFGIELAAYAFLAVLAYFSFQYIFTHTSLVPLLSITIMCYVLYYTFHLVSLKIFYVLKMHTVPMNQDFEVKIFLQYLMTNVIVMMIMYFLFTIYQRKSSAFHRGSIAR